MSKDSKTRQLVQAIEHKNLELARKLILQDEFETTISSKQVYYMLIKTAVESRDVPLIRTLLELKPKLHDTIAAELLWMVVKDEDTEIATMLVEASRSAMLCAIASENLDFLRELLERGVVFDEHALEVIVSSRQQISLEMMMLLVNGDHVNDPTTRAELVTKAFELICRSSHSKRAPVSLIKALLDLHIPAASVILKGAFIHANANVLKLLFERTDIDERVRMLFLHHSIVDVRNPSTSRMLIDCGADIEYPVKIKNECFSLGMRPLHVACLCRSKESLQILLDLGADVNATDVNGRTPFSLMVANDLSKVHRMMIKRFALLTSKGDTVNDKDLAFISSWPEFQEFYDHCLRELQVMMESKHFNGTTVFSTLMKNHKELSLLLRSRKFYVDYKNKLNTFFLYGEDLKCQFKKAAERNDLLMLKVDALYEALNGILPDVPMEKIIRHLYFSDFEVLENTAAKSGTKSR